ncbi:MAG TPA: excisionase family DNA-binding protein [Anaeromyxobacteraceae bacterium]|nr:excisionase family DNA-binding protein [Anaeromyxobacteraceae bacterium]
MRGFYTTHEAARLLGVSLPTVVNWIKARRIKAHRTPGGHRRISREDLAGFMVRHGMPLPEELSGAAPTRRKALVLGEVGPMREGLARQLAEGGYAVEQASPGFAAGAAAARFQPDLVVVAAASPEGSEAVAALRADRELSAVPVVAVGLSEWAERLTAAGCNAVLSRPLPDGALLEAAGEALAGVNGGSTRRGSRSRG